MISMEALDESYWDTEGRSPHPFYEKLREAGGIVWDDWMKTWLVVDAAYIRTIMMQESTFSHPYTSMKAGDGYKALRLNNPRSFQFLVGAEHQAMHRWWLKDLLSPQWVAQYHNTVVAPVITRILNELGGRDTFDLVDDLAERIPVTIFAELMDLPDRSTGTIARIKLLNDHIAKFASVANSLRLESQDAEEAQQIQQRAVEAAQELNEMLGPVVAARKDGTGSDFVSRLWAGGNKIFADWNEIDTLDSCRRLLFAGSDTTTISLENAFYMLLTDNALMTTVREGGREKMPSFVEEVLRLNGSVQFRPRRAVQDTELGGKVIRKGDMVLAILQGANRDKNIFACPEAVDLQRRNARNHFTFNVGARACPGSNLARAELREALSQTLERFPDLKLINPREPTLQGFLFRAYRPLHVRAQRDN